MRSEPPAAGSANIPAPKTTLRTCRDNWRRWQATGHQGKSSSEGPPVLHRCNFGASGISFSYCLVFILDRKLLILGALGGLAMLVVAAYLLFRRRVAPETAENPLTDAIAQNVRDAETGNRESKKAPCGSLAATRS